MNAKARPYRPSKGGGARGIKRWYTAIGGVTLLLGQRDAAPRALRLRGALAAASRPGSILPARFRLRSLPLSAARAVCPPRQV